MKTLILNGSPRKQGNTVTLINRLVSELDGEVTVIDAYYCDISPCVDCRYCVTHTGCAVQDGMQSVYRLIQESDNIVIASPVYFNELTGRLLDVISRCQMYFCAAHFQGVRLITKKKKGAVILVGGGLGTEETALKTAGIILRSVGCDEICEPVCSMNTDTLNANDDEKALSEIIRMAEFLNIQRK